jgi:glycoside/pentoside/hexuronide:cation symporter, GPH family
VWTAGETTGMALGAAVFGLVLSLTGYLESTGNQVVEQSATAVSGIVLSFSLVPAALLGLSLWTLGRYPLRRSDVDDDLDALELDAEDDAGTPISPSA